jgi:5S rRNA maturation endonuclease (ribonuclease M5)
MFTLEIEQKITKELLLKHNTEETYMEHYLGIPVKKGLHISPLREDKRPTASFYRNKNGELIFHDFGEPFSGNFISVVCRLFQCSYYRALKIIANDFKIIESKNYKINPPKIEYTGSSFKESGSSCIIQIKKKDFSKEELHWWKTFGISLNTLNKYKVFSCESIFLNGNYFESSSKNNFIFGYYGGKVGDKELWRIYMPMKKSYRFLSNWNSSLIQGAKQLPKESDYCIFVKSLKDTMVLDEYGFVACSPNSETTMPSQVQIQRIIDKYHKIFIFFDNDAAGVKNAHKYKKLYNCKCIFLKREYAKDISDLHKKLNPELFLEVVEELDTIIYDSSLFKTKYFYIF